jgi:hypothetical protein
MVIQLFEHSNENACACALAFFDSSIYRSTYYLPMLWISAYLNFLWVIYRHFNISQSKQRTHKYTCVLEYLCISIHRYLPFLPMLWISTHLNLQWMIYRPLNISQSKSRTLACTCALVFLGIPIIIYLCSEYQLKWTFNQWFIHVCVLVLAN